MLFTQTKIFKKNPLFSLMDKQYEINLVIYILRVVSKGKINRRVEAEVRKWDLEGFLMSDAI